MQNYEEDTYKKTELAKKINQLFHYTVTAPESGDDFASST